MDEINAEKGLTANPRRAKISGKETTPMNVRPKVTMLTEKDVRLVHEASLEILEQTGVLYENKKALDLIGANGQKVDRDKGVAWLKPDLVERCMKTVPRHFVLASRDGKNDAVIAGGQMHHMTDGEAS